MQPITTKLRRIKPVLVVDDDEGFRDYITELLQAEGIPCLKAGSVGEAIHVLRQTHVSLLLLDWCLDNVATEVVRTAQSISPLMPIIIISGRPYGGQADALFMQTDEFLNKTLGGSVVADRVKRWVDRLEAAPAVFLPQREEDILPLEEVKRQYICHAVRAVGNRISLAAQKLGVHRQTVSAAVTSENLQQRKPDQAKNS
jgi:DNA-binding NtrC family response regulator